jgi:hypothetical protein
MAESLTWEMLEVAACLVAAEEAGYGFVADNKKTEELLSAWEDSGWTRSRIDSGGDRIFLLTSEGRAAFEEAAGKVYDFSN